MNDGQLSAFVVVADTGSITAAAPRLFVSQQVLTKRLRSLEAELGYPLFVRSHEGVRLTDAGREFYEDAVQLLAIRERALTRKLVPTPPRNTLHISYRSDASTMVLGHVCERCAKLHPEVEQVIVPLRSEEQLEAIASGRVDVTEWPQSNSVGNYGLSFKSLVGSPHVCVVRRQHPLAQAETVLLGDLENLDVTMLD